MAWTSSESRREALDDGEQAERERLTLLESSWNAQVGSDLQMASFARRVGRMYEAGCTHQTDGWSFSYLAATPEAAFAGLTQIASRRDLESGGGRSLWKRYARS